MKKPFPLFDLEGLSFTVSETILVGCDEFFPGYKYTFNVIKLKAYKFSPNQTKKHGIEATHSFTFANIYNGHTGLNVNLRACLEEITPLIDRVYRESESLLVSTISEPTNEQLLLFRS